MALILSRSLRQKLLVMAVAMVGFVFLYEAGTFDSLEVAPTAVADPAGLATGTRHLFTATAYCKGTKTASGVNVRTGIAASDAAILPVGSVVNITTGTTKYNGVYTIMDTGPKVQGRLVDIYMWSCYDALAFGRQQIEVTVLRLGWNPGDSVPSLVDRLFRRREATRATAVAAAPPPEPEPAVNIEEVNIEEGAASESPEPLSDATSAAAVASAPSATPTADVPQPEPPAPPIAPAAAAIP
jgi:3D (Asp-Asp-Asp) domain-containing protein